MPQWNLYCLRCDKRFDHSTINPHLDGAPYDPLWPPKPAFPEGGERVKCPLCKETATYQRYQLVYSAPSEEKRVPFRTDFRFTT